MEVLRVSDGEVLYVEVGREHVAGIMRLCELEGWPSFLEDGEKTWRVLTAPGVITVVAVYGGAVVGFAELQTDGAIQAHLSNILVDHDQRRNGIGRRLVEDCFTRSGAKRIDLVSTEGADAFYESFEHRGLAGYRIYPDGGERASR